MMKTFDIQADSITALKIGSNLSILTIFNPDIATVARLALLDAAVCRSGKAIPGDLRMGRLHLIDKYDNGDWDTHVSDTDLNTFVGMSWSIGKTHTIVLTTRTGF
jgi:hypothetical protein